VISSFKIGAILTALLLAAPPVYAQVCNEIQINPSRTGATAKSNLGCDMKYRNTNVSCDAHIGSTPSNYVYERAVSGTRPSCPKKPMPMIETNLGSYITDYTKYLYIFPRDPKDVTRPYAGTYATGTPGDASRTFQMFGNTPAGTKRIGACTSQIKLPENPRNDAEWARFVRLQLDNCTNQYILNRSIYPFQKEDVKLRSMDDALDYTKDPATADYTKMLDLEGECQPLRMVVDTQNEYSVSEYLKWAWEKTMLNPDARKTTKGAKCLHCVSTDVPCDREPHLPCGVKLENTDKMKPIEPFPEINLSELGAVQYEEIIDPTHPFSPRWDWLLTDRDYSNLGSDMKGVKAAARVASSDGSRAALVGTLYFFMGEYMTDAGRKESTFCAGVKKAKDGASAAEKKNLEVEVDVLEFRRSPYEKALTKRVMYNFLCKQWTAKYPSGRDALFYVAPTSFCFQITGFSFWYPWVFAKDFDCWDCYGLSGKVDDESQHPPCTHNYIGGDKSMIRLPGGLNSFKRDARCGTAMDAICRDLRKPFTPMNKLKMRYHNPNDPDDKDGDNVALTAGVPEGLTFKEYFGNRMPYPRLWDTGSSIQNTPTSDGNYQPPLDTTGQHTAIVGVGREATTKAGAGTAKDSDGIKLMDKHTDQRCKTMGWSSTPFVPVRFGGVTVVPPDPMSSWTELKLYQARTARNTGLSCIARYEKVFKPGSAENMILIATGAEYKRAVISECERDRGGRTKNCTFLTLKEYEKKKKDRTLKPTTTHTYIKELKTELWPNSWRGYMSAMSGMNQFPWFGDGYPETFTGLDNAEIGDIILLPFGPRNDADKPGLAKLALITEARLPANSDCMDKENCYVQVSEPDNGKWPDICGTTDTWGEMKSRYYFKPGHLPKEASDEYNRIASVSHCGETRISHCEQTAWNNLEIYRIRNDERAGCNKKDKAAKCQKDE
jgi:hypothetical protein